MQQCGGVPNEMCYTTLENCQQEMQIMDSEREHTEFKLLDMEVDYIDDSILSAQFFLSCIITDNCCERNGFGGTGFGFFTSFKLN